MRAPACAARRSAALAAAVVLAALPAAAAPAADHDPATWSRAEQRAAALAGFPPAGRDAARPLTRDRLRRARDVLAFRTATDPVPVPDGPDPVSVAAFHRAVVAQLGLADVAGHVQEEARAAGLRPPARFGDEVVARLLGLRANHPWPRAEHLERYPWEPISRAEAAWSYARLLELGPDALAWVRLRLEAFALPHYSAVERAALRIAVSRIGMPYIWGGESDGPAWGQVRGGYDCSGLVWRVFKLSGLPAGRAIGGRTAAQQAGEVPRTARVRRGDVRPGDLLFFGSARFWSRATEANTTHEAIALSSTWAINASSQGTYLLPLDEGRLRERFTWARRVL